MKLLDRIALNRILVIITNFILSLIKILNNDKGVDSPAPKRKSIIDRLKNLRNKKT